MNNNILTLEEIRKNFGDSTLTEEQAMEKYKIAKEKFDNEVDKQASRYKHLDINEFINHIGGYEKIEDMKKINEIMDKTELVNGKLVPKRTTSREDLEEWKKGFMEGFEEAYKRLNSAK